MLKKINLSLKNNKFFSSITTPEIFVLSVLLLFGSFLAFRIPLGAGFDEETHLLRVWEMSSFHWIPNSELPTRMRFPAFFWENSYRRQAILQPVDPNFWSDQASTAIFAEGDVSEYLTTRSVYSPLLLLPQSLLMFFLGRVLLLPALTTLIAMRLAGLLSYTLLAWYAVRKAPFAKWLWAVMVIAPMAIYQASTISTDSISNGIGFLFVSLILFIATLPEVRWKEWTIMVVLFSILYLAKLNMVLLALLPFFILPPSRFKMKRGYLLLGIVAIALALFEVGGWNVLAYSRFYSALPGADPASQLQFILAHPVSTAGLVISDIGNHLLSYLQGWIADYGYGYWGSPWLVYPLYLAALILTFFMVDGSHPDKRTRFGLLLVFGLSFLATLFSLYISYTPVGSPEILGVHGRYFTVILPLLLLGLYRLSTKTVRINPTVLSRITVGVTLFGILLFSIGMYVSFYVRCGYVFFKPGLCYQPTYKNWSPNSSFFPPLTSGNDLTQWIIPKCNGMQSLQVWVDSSGSDPTGKTQFILNNEDMDIIQLDETIANSDLPQKGWYSLTFPEDWQSGGKWYTLTVQNPEPSSVEGIRLASSLQSEYIDAPLLMSGIEQDKDLIFQYGCKAGWSALFHQVRALINKN